MTFAEIPPREVLDFVRLCVRLRDTEGSDEEPIQHAALEWLDCLGTKSVPDGSKPVPTGCER